MGSGVSSPNLVKMNIGAGFGKSTQMRERTCQRPLACTHKLLAGPHYLLGILIQNIRFSFAFNHRFIDNDLGNVFQ